MRKSESQSRRSSSSPAPSPGVAPDAPTTASDRATDRARALPMSAERPRADDPPRSAEAEALRLIADASEALAGSLELDEVLAAVGRIAVPRLADACVLDFQRTGDRPPSRHLLATSYEPETEALAREYLQRYPAGDLDPRAARALAAGEPVVLSNLDEAYYRRIARSPERFETLRRLHPRGALVVALRAHGRTIGAMSLIYTESPRTPSASDVTVALELGHRVAQAVHNARLYAAVRRSETRLFLALDGADQLLWDFDFAGSHLWVDRRLSSMLGRSPEELHGDPQKWTRVIHPADVRRGRAAISDHLEGRAPRLDVEFRMQHADGSWRWMRVRGRVVERDVEPGRPRRLAGTIADVTERRRAAETRVVLAHTVNASADLVCTLGADGRVRYMNPAGLRLLHAPSLDAVVGRDYREFHTDTDQDRLAQARHALLEGPGRWTGEYYLRRFDGGPPVHVEAHELAVHDPQTGELVAIAAVLRDLTEREASAAERERLAEQARHAQRIESLGVLAGSVAHDFNNLLTVILSTLDLARSDLPAQHPVQSDLETLRATAKRASELTRQLLGFSRRRVLETRLLDLNTLVSDAETLLRRLVGERVTFDVAVAPQPLPVRGDPVLLEQVLVNLVLNARDAVTQRPEGGLITVETAELTLDPERAPACGARPGKYVRFSVHDTGPGMDAETRARVFEPFFTTKPVGEGTGLGLAMVQNIVTQLGGTVHVESEPGHGSTFRVLLPRAAEEGAEGLTETPPVVAPHGRETVLLVEDEAAVRDVARRILERAGYTVYEARHGADALLVWREQGGARGNIDVLLTDVRMPELGGRELAAALRRERPDLPVVFVSGYAQSETRGAGERELFVAKPFVAPELQSAVRQVLDAARSAA